MSKREPEQVWKALVKEAAEDQAAFQRAAGASREEVEASLAAQGLDPEAEREAAGDFRREIQDRIALRKARAAEEQSTRRPVRSRSAVLLLAATLGAAVGGGLVYAATHRAATAPAPAPPPAPAPTTAPTPDDSSETEALVAAATLRRDALAECDAKQWDTCLADLDRARALDPAGDEASPVEVARKKAIAAIVAKAKP